MAKSDRGGTDLWLKYEENTFCFVFFALAFAIPEVERHENEKSH